jgi:single-strand DNA-binding protein
MADYNRVILMGRLTRDPELRYIPSGTAVCEFGLAVNDRRKNNQTGEWVEDTQFIDITMWARQAEIASEYLSKGSPVFVEGRLKFDSWEKDGQKYSKLRVVGEKMQFIGGRGDASAPSAGGSAEPQHVPAGNAPEPTGEDIPF